MNLIFQLTFLLVGLTVSSNVWSFVIPTTITNNKRRIHSSSSRIYESSTCVVVDDAATINARTDVAISGISPSLAMTLKKPSKTLSVIFETDYSSSSSSNIQSKNTVDLITRSMQLRKIGTTALATNDISIATEYVKEQCTAKGSFPGPCPVLYLVDSTTTTTTTTDDDILTAISNGITILSVPISKAFHINELIRDNKKEDVIIDLIYQIETLQEVQEFLGTQATKINNDGSLAFLISADNIELEEVLKLLPKDSVVIASLTSMQVDNNEITTAKNFPVVTTTTVDGGEARMTVHSVLLQKAIIGDNEDISYAQFIMNGITKKKSSTFKVSGLTGSTNGHFGGVESKTSTTWLRQK